MLLSNRSSVAATAQLISQSVNSKQLIVARPGTPLHEIASPCVGVFAANYRLDNNNAVGSAENLCYRVINASVDQGFKILRSEPTEEETTNYGVSSHSTHYIGLACAMAEVIKRNLVLCEEASEMIGKSFESVNQLFSHQDLVMPINIVPLVGGIDLVNAGTLLDFAKGKIPKGRDAIEVADVPIRYPVIENLDDFPVLKLIEMGNTSLDSQLKEWAALGGAKLMLNVYNSMFAHNQGNEPYFRVTYDMLKNFDSNSTPIDVVIAMLVIAINIENSGIECGSGITLDELEFGLTSTRIFAANVLVSELERLARQRESGVVVHQYPRDISPFDDWKNDRFDIVVDKVTYDDFIASGGTPEILFGSYMVEHQRNKEALLERADYFITAWKDHEATLRHKRHQDEVTRIYREVRNQCYRDYNELSQDARASIDTSDIADALERFSGHLEKTGVSGLYNHMRELYCTVFYCGTEVKDLLRTIDEVNCDKTMSQGAVLRIAIVEYCSRILMDQTESVEYIDNAGE